MNEKCSFQTMEEILFGIPPREIDDGTFEKVGKSYQMCLSLIWIEEKFNIVSGNYYEWEQEINESYDFFLANQNDKSDCNEILESYGMEKIVVLNRRLNNLLSTIRLYRDQVLHGLSLLDKKLCDTNLKTEFDKETKKLYDQSISYQLMELIRNYMQHEGLIVERITAVIPFNRNIGIKLPFFIETNYKELKKLGKFQNKIKLKDNLNQQGEWINLIVLVREYYKQIIALHNKYRDITHSIFENASQVITLFVDNYYEKMTVKTIALYGRKDKDGYKDFLVQLAYLKKLKEYRQLDIKLDVSKSYINKKAYIDSGNIQYSNSVTLNIRYNM